MSVRIERVELPGIGVRHDVLTSGGRRVAIVSHRSGERDIAFVDAADPDSCTDTISLSEDEAGALADVLGGSVMLEQLAGLREQASGLYTEQIPLPADSPYAGRPLGDTRARTRTGASIVAVLRGTQVVPSPGPAEVLAEGDTLVAVGTRSGLDALSRLISPGSS